MRNYNEYINKIIYGHALEILPKLPKKIAQCCITSPPYWGLRTYSGNQERIWGGDTNCEHQWDSYLKSARGGKSLPNNMPNVGSNKVMNQMNLRGKGIFSNFCYLCGAWKGALGLEPMHDCLAWARGEPACPSCYICHLRMIFTQVWRVLRDDGTLWLNLGDCYAGSGKAGTSIEYQRRHLQFGRKERKERMGLPTSAPDGLKPKDLIMVPARVALALQADGWYLRSMIPWLKRNATPESVLDRPTTANEWIFMLTKSRKYYYNIDAVRIPHSTFPNRNITNLKKYQGKFSKNICETVSSPRARQNREGYTPSYYHQQGRNRRTAD